MPSPKTAQAGNKGAPRGRHLLFLSEPAQRRGSIGLVVREGLCRYPEWRMVQLTDRYMHVGPARRDRRLRALEPFGDLAQRTDPMGFLGRREVAGGLDRLDRDGEARLEEGGEYGH
jgi:hypothetical protein